jgi:kynurenine formamidase
MSRQLVDLSVLVENTQSEPMRIDVKRLDHRRGARQFARRTLWQPGVPAWRNLKSLALLALGKGHRLRASDFPDKQFLTLDTVTMPTHMGTHVDAPIHYGELSEGKPARSVDQLPLDWFFAPAIRLDLRHMKPGASIGIADLDQAIAQAGVVIHPGHIVLIWTGVDKLWGSPRYFREAPGMSREATEWLVAQGIKVIGTDTYGFDRPFPAMLRDFFVTGDRKHLWPAHFYGREKEYIQIERLCNLDAVPASGFELACFPLRIKGLDASWVRAVAILQQ